jgi:hypothetical protein
MASVAMRITKVSATTFRDKFNDCARKTKGRAVTLVENRQSEPKYFIDKAFFDSIIKENESIKATFEILADHELTSHLMKLAETIDGDVRSGKIHLNSMADMFGNE